MKAKVIYYGKNKDNKIIVWSVNIHDMIFNSIPEMLKFFGYDKHTYVYMGVLLD